MNRSHTPKIVGLLSDVLLWGVLLVGIGLGVFFFTHGQPKGQTIHLAFHDANEITRGSMVRMMGMEVGYVKDIHLHPSYVEVVLQTHPNALPIPSGSTFTVLFTGIVGSKSIEIIPPDLTRPPVNGQPSFLVEEPIRLGQALQYQIDIAQALQKGAENFADFFGRKKPVEELQFNIITSRNLTAKGAHHLAMARDILNAKTGDSHTTLHKFEETAKALAQVGEKAEPLLDSQYLKPTSDAVVRYADLFLTQGQQAMDLFQQQGKIVQLHGNLVKTSGQLQKAASSWKTGVTSSLCRVDSSLVHFYHILDQSDRFFSPGFIPHLQETRQKLGCFNQQLQQWNQKL